MQILAALVFSALVKIPVMLSTPLQRSFTLAPSGLSVKLILLSRTVIFDLGSVAPGSAIFSPCSSWLLKIISFNNFDSVNESDPFSFDDFSSLLQC